MTLETLCSQPPVLQSSIAALADLLRRDSIDVACGPLNEGAFVALMVAQALGCRFAYAERFAPPSGDGLFAVAYRLPAAQRAVVTGKRVAILNDVISAGSAVRGTYDDLIRLDANVVVVGSLLLLGEPFNAFARERSLRVEALERMPYNLWTPGACPLCRSGAPLDDLSG